MLLALLLLLAATTAALEQDGKDYDLYTTASALRNLAGGFASEVEVTADGRVKKLIFDGTADLLAERGRWSTRWASPRARGARTEIVPQKSW